MIRTCWSKESSQLYERIGLIIHDIERMIYSIKTCLSLATFPIDAPVSSESVKQYLKVSVFPFNFSLVNWNDAKHIEIKNEKYTTTLCNKDKAKGLLRSQSIDYQKSTKSEIVKTQESAYLWSPKNPIKLENPVRIVVEGTSRFLENTKANDRGDASERSIRSTRGTRLEGRKRAPGGRTRGSSRVDDRPGTEKAEGSKDCHAPLIPFRPLFRLHPPSFIHERNYQPLLFIIPGLTVQLCIVTRTVPPGKGKVARPVRMCRSPIGKGEERERFRTVPSFQQSRNFQKFFTWKIQPLIVTFFQRFSLEIFLETFSLESVVAYIYLFVNLLSLN